MENKQETKAPDRYSLFCELEVATKEVEELAETFRGIHSDDRSPETAVRSLVPELMKRVSNLRDKRIETRQAFIQAAYKTATGRPLTKDEYFLMRALGCIDYHLCRDRFDEFKV